MQVNTTKLLRVFLILVGLGLIIIPLEYFGFFGFEGYQGGFFKVQGGVFHIVMCGAYIPAAIDAHRNAGLLRFSIFAKFTATIFLLSYAVLAEGVWMVVLSGILDFLMGLILVWFYRRLKLNRSVGSAH